MFVDERAMGEPYQPEKQYRLPLRFIVGILVPIPVALFSYAIGISYTLLGNAGAASTWMGAANMSVALSCAVGLIAVLRMHTSKSEQRDPPF